MISKITSEDLASIRIVLLSALGLLAAPRAKAVK